MYYRVEELAARAATSVDTIRYYQARNLLPSPTRVGRVAWYGDEHLERLAQIRGLQGRGFGLAVIQRLLAGELDRADEALIAAVASQSDADAVVPPANLTATITGDQKPDDRQPDDRQPDDRQPDDRQPDDRQPNGRSPDDRPPAEDWLTIEQLAARSGIPLVVLEAVVREGLLVPHRMAGEDRYSHADVIAAAAGLRLLEHGLPLPELLQLARAHTVAMRATAQRAVELFDRYVRQAPQSDGVSEDEAAERLVSAFEEILPATLTIVSHHFRRTLLAVAQEHIERVGSDGERQLVTAAAARTP